MLFGKQEISATPIQLHMKEVQEKKKKEKERKKKFIFKVVVACSFRVARVITRW